MSRAFRIAPSIALAALFFALACHSGPKPGEEAEGPQPTTTLTVENQGFVDMDIYVLPQGGNRIRLGTASGNSTTHLKIPDFLVRTPLQMRFLASPIGGTRSPVSQSIQVEPGDDVVLQIPPS